MSEKASGSSIRVMVVDDHELFRQGVSSILSRIDDVEVVAEAENGRVAVQKAREYRPDVVLMDINMPVCDGLKATRQIKAEYPDIRILILTVTDTEEMLFEAIKSGASGYVLKNATPALLIDSVKRVSAGEPVIPGNLAMRIITEFSKPTEGKGTPVVDQLTDARWRCCDISVRAQATVKLRERCSSARIPSETMFGVFSINCTLPIAFRLQRTLSEKDS